MLSDPFLPRRRSLSTPHGILDPCRAVQSQGSLSPPYCEAATRGDQLGRVRRRPTRPRQSDGLVHTGGNRGLGGSAAVQAIADAPPGAVTSPAARLDLRLALSRTPPGSRPRCRCSRSAARELSHASSPPE